MPDDVSQKAPAKAGAMTVEKLRSILGPVQEAKGYPFSADEAMVTDLLEQLLVNKDRYGYMACPCRLANGTFEKDRDVVCPCAYRAADVVEYGECFCGLYVDPACKDGTRKAVYVPDRRPPEKIEF